MAYCARADVRAMPGLETVSDFTDTQIDDAIEFAEEDIDRYTRTSFEFKAFSITLDGNGRRSILLRTAEGRVILYPQTLTSVTVNGDVEVATNWKLHPEGLVIRDSGTFKGGSEGQNVVVAGTAGMFSSPPNAVQWACRMLARQHLLDGESRVDDRALQIQNDYGTVQLAQATNHPERPTSIPEVNARLARYRQSVTLFG